MVLPVALALLFCAASRAVLVPGPTGRFAVAMEVQALSDTSRRDPLDPTGKAQDRRLLMSVFLPVEKQACPAQTVAYMTPSVADAYGEQAAAAGLPAGLFRAFELRLCDLSRMPACRGERPRYPLVLFSPGFGDSRLLYSAMARSLASQGYVVVTVDHPYDAISVEFPDGSVIHGANISSEDPAAVKKVVQVRNDDLSFVLSQLHNQTVVGPLLGRFPGAVDLARTVVVGHSLGGAASAALARSDDRVLGGVDLDGQLVDPVKTLGLSKPFLLAGRPGHSSQDATWNDFWPHLAGPRMELAVNGTTHGSFTDRPILLSALDLPDPVREALKAELGTIDAQRLDKVLNGVLTSFFDLALYRRSGALSGISRSFSQVIIERQRL